MIEEGRGNLLTADVEALVNTVNTVGVMGKGIALQFKRAYPANFRAYREACARGDVRIGSVWTFDSGGSDHDGSCSTFPPRDTGATVRASTISPRGSAPWSRS